MTRGPTVGQAFKVTEEVDEVTLEDSAIWFPTTKVFAQRGDTIPIDIKFQGPGPVDGFATKIHFTASQISLERKSPGVYGFIKSKPDQKNIADGDLVSIAAGTATSISGPAVAATLQATVAADATENSQTTISFTADAADQSSLVFQTTDQVLCEGQPTYFSFDGTSCEVRGFAGTVTLTVTDECEDNDGDGYGACGTDTRACTNSPCTLGSIVCDTLEFTDGDTGDTVDDWTSTCDADDSTNQIHPGKAESCDGLDNNQDGLTDNGISKLVSAVPGSDLLNTGVCKDVSALCGDDPTTPEATVAWYVDTAALGPDYRSSEVAPADCDFIDNDCNGDIDGFDGTSATSNIGCPVLTDQPPALIGQPLGNVWVDYDDETKEEAPSDPQLISSKDTLLLFKLKNQYQDSSVPNACGHPGGHYCVVGSPTKTQYFACWSGHYYVYKSGEANLKRYSNGNLVIENAKLLPAGGLDPNSKVIKLSDGLEVCPE